MQKYDTRVRNKKFSRPIAAVDRERSAAVLAEFQEVEALIKQCILEDHLDYTCHKITCLIREWKALYSQKYGGVLTDEVWQTTNLYKWLLLHHIHHEMVWMADRNII